MAFSFGAGQAQKPAGLGFGGAGTAAGAGFGGFGAASAAVKPQGTVAPTFGGFGQAPAAAPPAASTAFSFGQTGATTAFGFGSQAAPASGTTGFGFGQTSVPSSTTTTTFGFGQNSAASVPSLTAATTTFGFGQPAAATQPAPSFGGFGSAPVAASSTEFGFGKTTITPAISSSSGGFGFGQPASAAPPPAFGTAFGAAASSAFKPAGTLGAATAPPAFGGGFGTASSASAGGFSFGTATTSSSFGAFGQPQQVAQPLEAFGGGFGQQQQLPALQPPPAVVGLGGVMAASSLPGGQQLGGGHHLQGDHRLQKAADPSSMAAAAALKEAEVSAELLGDIENLKKFVKDERAVSSDIAHVSAKMHLKIKAEIGSLNAVVRELSAGVAKQKARAEKLKQEVAQELLNVEMAQRTKDTPPTLQVENVAPYEYFYRLVADFEAQMVSYKRQIQETEHHLTAMASSSSSSSRGGGSAGSSSGADDLVGALQKVHLAFVGLAGKYQPIHESVNQQKVNFVLKFRQINGGTTEDPFEELRRKSKSQGQQPDGSGGTRWPQLSLAPKSSWLESTGPTPFSGRADPLALAKAALLTSAQTPQVVGRTIIAATGAGAPNQFVHGVQQGGFGVGGGATSSGFGGGLPATSAGTAFGFNKPFGFATPTSSQQQQQATLAFGQTQAAAGTTGGGFNFPNVANPATPGLLGNALSPFSQASSPFQTSMKRGKH